MRTKIVAGNWKMNTTREEAASLASEITTMVTDRINGKVEIVVCPPAIHLSLVTELTKQSGKIKTGAQNCSSEKAGAFTGEISASMIHSAGATHVILGHSERRTLFAESDELISKKVDRTLENNLIPVFCCGETLEERKSANHFHVVKRQIEKGVFHLSEVQFQKVVIAYEPVWAIGTGLTATPAEAQEMHAFIRSLIKEKFNNELASGCRILYGGSCNENNASELFSLADVDGGLIGGASLKSKSFLAIIQSAIAT